SVSALLRSSRDRLARTFGCPSALPLPLLALSVPDQNRGCYRVPQQLLSDVIGLDWRFEAFRISIQIHAESTGRRHQPESPLTLKLPLHIEAKKKPESLQENFPGSW